MFSPPYPTPAVVILGTLRESSRAVAHECGKIIDDQGRSRGDDPDTREGAAPQGITVNVVASGLVDTDMNAAWLRASDESRATAAAASAFNRIGTPADVADVVAFVASEEARWVTGQVLDATGGSVL